MPFRCRRALSARGNPRVFENINYFSDLQMASGDVLTEFEDIQQYCQVVPVSLVLYERV